MSADRLAVARASLDGSGMTLSDDGEFVRVRDAKPLGLAVTVKRGRAQVRDVDNKKWLYWSGPPSAVRTFTRQFWLTP